MINPSSHRHTNDSMRRSPARSALSLCLSLACLALVWHVVTLAAWLTSRVTLAATYLADVGDLTDLAERPGVREAVQSLTASGTLARLEKDVVNRLHVVDDGTMALGVDVSHSGEATWVYRRYRQVLKRSFSDAHPSKVPRSHAGFAPLVVDVGANDGFLSSNSYNLARWGFSTVLIEPNPTMLKLAKDAQETLIDPYGEGRQHSCYVNAGMAGVPRATTMKLKIGKDVVAMESSLAVESSGTASGGGVKGSDSREKKELVRLQKLAALHSTTNTQGGTKKHTGKKGTDTHTVIEVDVLPVAEVGKRCDVPVDFALLSVDAEGEFVFYVRTYGKLD